MSRQHNVKMEPSPRVSTMTRNFEPNRATEFYRDAGRIKIKREEKLQRVKAQMTEMSDHSSNNLNTAHASQCVVNEKATVNVGIIGKWDLLRAKFSEKLWKLMQSYIFEIPTPIKGSVKTNLRRTEEALHRILTTIGCLYSSIIKIMDDHLNEACENCTDYQIIINRNDDRLQAICKRYEKYFTSNENTLRKEVGDFIHSITDTISDITRLETKANVQTVSYDQSSQFCTKLNQKVKDHNRYLEYFRTFVNNTRYGTLSDAKLSMKMVKKRKNTSTHVDDMNISKLIENFVKEVKETIDILISEYNDGNQTNETTDRLEIPTTSRAECQNSEAVSLQRHLLMQKTLQSLSYINMKIENEKDLKNDEYKILNEELDNIYCCEFRNIFTNEDMEILNRYKEVRSLLDEKRPQSHCTKILNRTNDDTQDEKLATYETSTEYSPSMVKKIYRAKSSLDKFLVLDDSKPSLSSVRNVPTSSTNFGNKIVLLDD